MHRASESSTARQLQRRSSRHRQRHRGSARIATDHGNPTRHRLDQHPAELFLPARSGLTGSSQDIHRRDELRDTIVRDVGQVATHPSGCREAHGCSSPSSFPPPRKSRSPGRHRRPVRRSRRADLLGDESPEVTNHGPLSGQPSKTACFSRRGVRPEDCWYPLRAGCGPSDARRSAAAFEGCRPPTDRCRSTGEARGGCRAFEQTGRGRVPLIETLGCTKHEAGRTRRTCRQFRPREYVGLFPCVDHIPWSVHDLAERHEPVAEHVDVASQIGSNRSDVAESSRKGRKTRAEDPPYRESSGATTCTTQRSPAALCTARATLDWLRSHTSDRCSASDEAIEPR